MDTFLTAIIAIGLFAFGFSLGVIITVLIEGTKQRANYALRKVKDIEEVLPEVQAAITSEIELQSKKIETMLIPRMHQVYVNPDCDLEITQEIPVVKD